ncbi:Inner membrane metabolite transport protein YhjE [Variovorax sp. SRS16]|uniref:MFS transporter n=1 Tax=Variovorax sp. SRS16 TaxID=282217 RepID=UPI0013169F18|nr:MFS transporter [Variovorax sp. SRS16]VTU16841.1 Inner membrane metabolite transport protein YhjE [Variovorax sp. SRS16]
MLHIDKRKRRYAAAASVIGTTIEVYDFFIFGTAAALVFGKQFFPGLDPTAALIASFTSYAVGYVARPLGAFIFGHFGDKSGRRDTLLITLLLMALPTILIGLMPNYDTIGIAAPILLCLLRIFQGIAFGGEWGGAVLLAVETAPDGRKSLWGALPSAGASAGIVLSTLAWAAASTMPDAAFQAWGWRLPFLASVVLLVIGVVLRLRIDETPSFQQARSSGTLSRAPLSETFRTAKLPMLKCVCLRVFENSWFAIVLVFFVSYAVTTAKIPKPQILNAIAFGGALSIPTLFAIGWLGDRIGQRIIYAFGAVALAAWTWVMFDAVLRGDPSLVVVIGLGLIWPCVYGPQSALFAAQFETRVRYSGLSIATQLAGILGGGIAPLVAALLVANHGGSPAWVALYLSALAVIGLIAVLSMRPTSALDLEPHRPGGVAALRPTAEFGTPTP